MTRELNNITEFRRKETTIILFFLATYSQVNGSVSSSGSPKYYTTNNIKTKTGGEEVE